MTYKINKTALTIAGSDSCGGAGIQRDLKTFTDLDCYGMSVITAVTAQNTQVVRGIHPLPAEFVSLQCDAVLSDIGADGIKLGMLNDAAIIDAVASVLGNYHIPFIVCDPVMVSTSGYNLLQTDAIAFLQTKLFPFVSLLTPNIHEAEILTGLTINNEKNMVKAAECLAELVPAVLIKGGHLGGDESPDYLCIRETGEIIRYPATRIHMTNSHGTGCTLSAAITAYLIHGYALTVAIEAAKHYLTKLLTNAATYVNNGNTVV